MLAPWDTSRVLAALTVDVQPVSARRFYLPAYAGTPEAHAGEREVLQEFADERTPSTNTIGEPLDAVGVDTACVGSSRGGAVELLEANGFERRRLAGHDHLPAPLTARHPTDPAGGPGTSGIRHPAQWTR